MNSKEFLDKNKEIQDELLDFIRNDENDTLNFESLQTLFNDFNIRNDKHDLTTLLHLLAKISNNHHRGPSFFDKIEKIIIIFKDDIKNFFSNSEIFNIFRSNKKILLFLIEEKILIFDEYIAKKITTRKYVKKCYPQYFISEIKPFINKSWFPKNNAWVEEIKKEIPENFYEKRKAGENDSYICELIRNDSVENFVQYITKNCYSLNSKIIQSIYETNSFLIKNIQPSLIEYAAFFGSIEIFQYLKMNNVEMNQSLWFYAIHGNNPEIIHLLEENLAKPTNDEYKKYVLADYNYRSTSISGTSCRYVSIVWNC